MGKMDTESPNVVMKHGKSLWQHRSSRSLVGKSSKYSWFSSTIPSGNLYQGLKTSVPSGYVKIAMESGPVEIVDLPS